jgi:hypothetical protein
VVGGARASPTLADAGGDASGLALVNANPELGSSDPRTAMFVIANTMKYYIELLNLGDVEQNILTFG